jgi:hypothetical protein
MRYFYIVGEIRNKSYTGTAACWCVLENYPSKKVCREKLWDGHLEFSPKEVVVTNIIEMTAEDYASFTSEL